MPGPVEWDKMRNPHKYERAVAVLLNQIDDRVQRMDGSGGDGGRDVHFRVDGRLTIYELKSFTGRVTKTRRRQIERSLAKAAKHQPAEWHCVVPIDLNPTEQTWFESLAASYPFPCRWRDLTWLDARMAEHPSVQRYFFEDGNAEVVSLMRDLAQEQAVMDGAPALIERLTRLAARADEIDPHYRITCAIDSEGRVQVGLAPRYAGAERDRPMTVSAAFSFPDTEAGRETALAVQEALTYGSGVTIPEEFVTSFDMDAPAGLDVSGAIGTLVLGPAEVHAPPFSIQMVVLSPDDRQLAALQLIVGQRTVGLAGGISAEATDPSQSMRCVIRTNPSTQQIHVAYDFRRPFRCLPAVALVTLYFLREFHAPNLVQIRIGSGDPIGPPMPLKHDEAPVKADYITIVEQLARVQTHGHSYFDLPETLTNEDVQDLDATDRILRGEVVRLGWESITMTMPPGQLVQFSEAEGSDLLAGGAFSSWHVTDDTLVIAGHSIPIGVCTRICPSSRLADPEAVRIAVRDAPDQPIAITLVPANDDAVALQLGPPSNFGPEVIAGQAQSTNGGDTDE